MYTGGCTKSGAVYILLPKISADIKICLCMPGARSAPSTLPAIMNEVLQHLGNECLMLRPTQQCLVGMGKQRQSILLRLQNPCARGKLTHLAQLHQSHPSSPRYGHRQNLAISPLNTALVRSSSHLQTSI